MGFLWETVKHFNLRGYLYIWANLAFVAVSLLLITMPLAWSALVRLSYLAQTSRHADIHDFWQAIKDNFWQGMGLGLLTALLLLLNLSNLYAYQHETGLFIWLLRGLWIGTLFFWFSLQLYLWPLYYEMEKPNLWTAFRNAFLMILLNPLFTLGLWLIIAVVVFLSSFFPAVWLLLSLSFLACLSASATLNRLRAAGFAIAKESQEKSFP